jgi:hypothetical protein
VESGSGGAHGRVGTLFRVPLLLTVTPDELSFHLRRTLSLKLPGGFDDYRFARDQINGLTLRAGVLFRDWGTLGVIHSVEEYATEFGYATEHLSRLRAALDEFGWDIDRGDSDGGHPSRG